MRAATDAGNTRDGPNPEQESTMPKAAKKNSTASLRETSPAAAPARPIVDPIFPNPAAILLPKGILQQDAVIIDEQDNHVVLTVRLPIDVIRDNQRLLRALLEIAAEKPRPPAEPEDLDEEG
jgi:hypothetical protein